MARLHKWILALTAMLLLPTALLAPVAYAQDPAALPVNEPLGLVDDSFVQAPAIQLVSSEPVVDEPAVPPGVEMPKSDSAMIMALVAGVGGLILGAMMGVFCCFFMFMTLYY